MIAGRNRLRWHEDEDDSAPETAGLHCWPGLAEGVTDEPRQHLVGVLSDTDADAFLSRFLTKEGEVLLTEDVRRHVIDVSSGLPLFLDLAIDRAVDLYVRGEEVRVESFARTHEGVVRRLLRDLDGEARSLLRHAALLPAWDVEILGEFARSASGPIRRSFVRRAFVHHEPGSALPYRIHAIVRDSVIGDTAVDDWDAQDWVAARRRAAEILCSRISASTDAHEEGALIRAAIDVCSPLTDDQEWLRLAVFRFRSLSELATALPPPPGGRRTYTGLLHRVLQCYTAPQGKVHLALRTLAESETLPPDLERAAWRHYAYRVRGQGDYEAALAIFRDLSERFDVQRDLHTHQIGLTLVSMGRLADAWEAVAGIPEERRVGVEASIMRWHGKLGEAISLYERRGEHLRRIGDKRVLGQSARLEHFCRALIDRGATSSAGTLRKAADGTGNSSAIVAAIAAQIVAVAGDGPGVVQLFSEANDIVASQGLGLEPRRYMALAFHHAVICDATGLEATLGFLQDDSFEGAVPLYRRVVEFWLDGLAGTRSAGSRYIQWSEDEDCVRQRWLAIVDQRRFLLGLSSA